jgi:hypothetical protein
MGPVSGKMCADQIAIDLLFAGYMFAGNYAGVWLHKGYFIQKDPLFQSF